MKKIAALVPLLILIHINTNAQSGTVKGQVYDTSNSRFLQHAVINLLRSNDSVLYRFTRTDDKGNFELKKIDTGKYIMIVAYPGFADYHDNIMANNQLLELGKISLTLKAKLLEEVIVRQQIAAMRMKGDTIEYKADSFRVSPGASVEEMLKKLPGIQVDKDGKITAQGEKIEKVLVDGEEFFGNDPTIATKNIEAEAIDKVQVFDKKSDQATFTGIDDGEKTKTLNLQLKEDRKRGVFGKVDIGGWPDNKWNNSVMANAFKGSRKLSVYGIMSNTGTTGLNWDDNAKYGDLNTNMEAGEDGSIYITHNYDDFNNTNNGIPKAYVAAANYGNKFHGDKENVNASYRYNRLSSEAQTNTTSQSILPDTLFYNNQSSYNTSLKQRNNANGSFDWKIDSTFSIKVTANGYIGNGQSNTLNESSALNGNKDTVNNSIQNTSSKNDNQSINTNVLLRKKFKKDGRTISLNLSQKYLENNTDGYLYSLSRFFDGESVNFLSDTVDQKKTNGNRSSGVSGKVSYTEPIIKNVTAEINYSLNNTNVENKLLSYNKDGNEKYNTLDRQYSNDYSYDILTNSGGATLRYNSKKYFLALGGNISNAHFNQKDLIKDSSFSYNYLNFFPRVRTTYKFNQTSQMTFNYNGSSRQPTIEQVQPVANNANPLNIAVGNPDLAQEFNHSFNASYNIYKVLKQRGFYISANFSTISNAIRTNTYTDSVGKSIYKYVNTTGNYNYGSWIGYNMKIVKWNMGFNTNLDFNGSNSINYVNTEKNISKNTRGGLRLGLYKEKEKKYDAGLSLYFAYNTSHASIRPDVKNNYWEMRHSLWSTVQLPKRFELQNNIDFNIRQKTDVFPTNNNTIIWNAYIAKKMLKNDKAQIRFSANDILKQNTGFYRNMGPQSVSETTYQTLGRYFMLSFIWNFTKTPMMAAASTNK